MTQLQHDFARFERELAMYAESNDEVTAWIERLANGERPSDLPAQIVMRYHALIGREANFLQKESA